MKKTIWTTDHRTLEHYREMSSMPFSVDLMLLTGRVQPWRALRVLFQGVDTVLQRFHHKHASWSGGHASSLICQGFVLSSSHRRPPARQGLLCVSASAG